MIIELYPGHFLSIYKAEDNFLILQNLLTATRFSTRVQTLFLLLFTFDSFYPRRVTSRKKEKLTEYACTNSLLEVFLCCPSSLNYISCTGGEVCE